VDRRVSGRRAQQAWDVRDIVNPHEQVDCREPAGQLLPLALNKAAGDDHLCSRAGAPVSEYPVDCGFGFLYC
jgi:hypothetical protein